MAVGTEDDSFGRFCVGIEDGKPLGDSLGGLPTLGEKEGSMLGISLG